MVERLLVSKTSDLNDEVDKGNWMAKGQSFTTDDDESLPLDGLQQAEDDSSKTSKSDINVLTPIDIQRSLLSFSSPSIDSINDPEESFLGISISATTKKKKQRRSTNQTVIYLKSSPKKKNFFPGICKLHDIFSIRCGYSE
jgi:hypothetical protein